MATGVSSWSQTASDNATADSTVNWAEGQAPSTVNDSGRALMASVAKWRDDIAGTLTTAGTSTAYTLTTNQSFGSLSAMDGHTVRVKFNAANGASATLNVDSLGAKAIQTVVGTAVIQGRIAANSIHDLTYDNSNSAWIIVGNVDATPVGKVDAYAGSSAPTGWLLCDGSAVSRTTYAALFALVSTTYGVGDGSTTFNVPDITGRVIAGKESSATRLTSAGSGVDGATLGATGGSETHTLTTDEAPSGLITLNDPGHSHTFGNSAGASPSTSINATAGGPSALVTTSSNTTGITLTDNGSDDAHNNVQPTIVLNYIIKT